MGRSDPSPAVTLPVTGLSMFLLGHVCLALSLIAAVFALAGFMADSNTLLGVGATFGIPGLGGIVWYYGFGFFLETPRGLRVFS